MKKNIAIVYGGYSSESVVSEKSLNGLMSFIDTDKYNLYPVLIARQEWSMIHQGKKYPIDKNDFSATIHSTTIRPDFVYITIHGAPGENGVLQGYFEMIGMPHSTCSLLPSAMTFNKFTCNTYLKSFGVSVAESVLIRKRMQIDAESIAAKVGMPCFVKPNAGGSSFGVTKVKNTEDIVAAVEKALTESDEVIIEQFIEGREVTCGLYKTKNNTTIFPLTEVISKNEFFDYEAKYTPTMAEEITPARIDDNVRDNIQSLSSAIYDILGMKGIARIDFIIGKEKIYLLEVNTTPGMTATSFIPQQIRAAGLDIKEVFTRVIEDSIEREENR
jgi:D-alanine-D-alanine ligase